MADNTNNPAPKLKKAVPRARNAGLWNWFRCLRDFQIPATGDHVWPVAPGVFGVYRDEGVCRVVCQYEAGEAVPPVAVGVTAPGSDTVTATARLDRRGHAELPAVAGHPCRIRVAAHVRDELDVAVLRRLGDERAAHQLELARANPLLPTALRFGLLIGTATARFTNPAAERLAEFVLRARGADENRRWYAEQVGAYENTHRAVAGDKDEEYDWSVPFGVRFTGVGADRETRWRLAGGAKVGPAGKWRADLVSTGDKRAAAAVRFEPDTADPDSVVVVVDGRELAAAGVGPGQHVGFLLSTNGYCSGPDAEVVVVRLVRETGTDPAHLARAGLLVDAWRALAPGARPTRDRAGFLLLAVLTPQFQALRALPDKFVTDPAVADEWHAIVNRLEHVRDALAVLLERTG